MRHIFTPALVISAIAAACDGTNLVQVHSVIEVSPAELTFDDLIVQTIGTKQLEIKNLGEANARIELEIDGDAAFTADESEGWLAPNTTITRAINFAPVELGETRARLIIRSDVEEKAVVVPLIGTARKRPRCLLSIEPEEVVFDGRFGATSEKTAALTNAGTGPCEIESVSIEEEASSPAFTIAETSARTGTLGENESLELRIAYLPDDENADQGRVIVHADDGEAAAILRGDYQRGRGCFFTVHTEEIEFPELPVGSDATLPIFVENHATSDPCFVHLSLDPSSHGDFSVAAEATVILPGEIGPAGVRFRPSGLGRREARVTVGAENVAATHSVVVRAGRRSSLCVTPSTLAFETAGIKTITLEACGESAVNITRLELSHPLFRIASSGSAVIEAGATSEVEIEYLATTATTAETYLLAATEDEEKKVRIAAGGTLPEEIARQLYDWGDRPPLYEPEVTVYVNELQGPTNRRQYFSPPGERCAGCHELSPDGRFMAVVETHVFYIDEVELRIIDTRSGELVIPATPALKPVFLSWRPNITGSPSYQLAYSDWYGDIHLYSPFLGELGLLEGASEQNYFETQPTWGPDGKIAFVKSEISEWLDLTQGIDKIGFGFTAVGEMDIMTIPENGGTPAPLAGVSNNEYGNFYPQYSPNGEWIAFVRTAIGEPDCAYLPADPNEVPPCIIRLSHTADDARIQLVRADGSGETRDLGMVNALGTRATTPSWSTDGLWLGFATQLEGDDYPTVWITAIDPVGVEGMPQMITERGRLSTWPRFSR